MQAGNARIHTASNDQSRHRYSLENNLDALVYAYTTIPPHIILTNRLAKTVETRTEPRILKSGTAMSDPTLVPGEPVLKSDLDTYRGSGSSFAVNLSPETGFPAIVVPAGFTREVYDRVPDDRDPNWITKQITSAARLLAQAQPVPPTSVRIGSITS
jgi:hypothetical protein